MKNKEKLKDAKVLDESHFSTKDFSSTIENGDHPPLKKRKISQWIQESDIFHFQSNEETLETEKPLEKKMIPKEDKIDEEKENSVPLEVILMFENAIRESTSNEEIRQKWKEIIEKQKVQSKNIPHILSRFDYVFVDGFQIEMNGVYRLNESALKRATKLKSFSMVNHHRMEYDRQRSSGHFYPAFHFRKKKEPKNKKGYVYEPKTIWGAKLPAIQQRVKSENLQKLFECW